MLSLSKHAIPASFVFLWATGFLGSKFGLPYAEPFTFLSLRFALVAAGFAALALALRAPWPDPRAAAHIAVAGLLVHGTYLGGVFSAIWLGVGAGVAALIVGIQPLLVAALAAPLLGEQVRAVQWLGLLLGLAGVALVVGDKLGSEGGPLAYALAALALLGMTAGTLYQKRFCGAMDLRSGNAIQYGAALLAVLPLAFAFETMRVDWTLEFVLALAWMCLALSFAAICLLYVLLRRGEAARVSSLFYLVPPCTALMAWALFGETLGPVALAGMACAVIGVALVNVRLRAALPCSGHGSTAPPAA